MEKFLVFHTSDTDEDALCAMLIYDGTRIGYGIDPPDFSTDIVVPPGKSPTDEDVFQEIKIKILKDSSDNFRLAPLKLEPGQYHPRIFRPFIRGAGRYEPLDTISMVEFHEAVYNPNNPHSCPPIPFENTAYSKTLSHLVLLSEKLGHIFRTVEPETSNLNTYGHEIRNLLIIACTEVEAQWKAVLKANGYSLNSRKKCWKTQDYVELLNPLKLAEYEIVLPLYPGIEPLSPFAKWDKNKPTQSLVWYDAYNATKHDRENNFSQANILNAVNSVAACAILLIAQFGKRDTWKKELGGFFRLNKVPRWNPEEMYMSFQNQNYSIKMMFDTSSSCGGRIII